MSHLVDVDLNCSNYYNEPDGVFLGRNKKCGEIMKKKKPLQSAIKYLATLGLTIEKSVGFCYRIFFIQLKTVVLYFYECPCLV